MTVLIPWGPRPETLACPASRPPQIPFSKFHTPPLRVPRRAEISQFQLGRTIKENKLRLHVSPCLGALFPSWRQPQAVHWAWSDGAEHPAFYRNAAGFCFWTQLEAKPLSNPRIEIGLTTRSMLLCIYFACSLEAGVREKQTKPIRPRKSSVVAESTELRSISDTQCRVVSSHCHPSRHFSLKKKQLWRERTVPAAADTR